MLPCILTGTRLRATASLGICSIVSGDDQSVSPGGSMSLMDSLQEYHCEQILHVYRPL